MEEQLHAENDVVRGDANQIHQVFVNLIMNSITAMKENGGGIDNQDEAIRMVDQRRGIPNHAGAWSIYFYRNKRYRVRDSQKRIAEDFRSVLYKINRWNRNGFAGCTRYCK